MMNRRNFATMLCAAMIGTSAVAADRTVTLEEVQAAFVARGPDTGRMIQRSLAGHGYYRGIIDGLWGPGTANGFRQMMASAHYRRMAPRFPGDHKTKVIETMFFLTSDAWME